MFIKTATYSMDLTMQRAKYLGNILNYNMNSINRTAFSIALININQRQRLSLYQ